MPDLKKGVDSSSLVSLMYSLYLQMRTGVGKSLHGTTLIILTQAPLLLANSHQHNGCPIFLVNLTLFFVLGCSFNCQFTDCIPTQYRERMVGKQDTMLSASSLKEYGRLHPANLSPSKPICHIILIGGLICRLF